MLELLKDIDIIIFDAINGFGTPYLDYLMLALSDTLFWLPFYIIIIYYLWTKYKIYIWLPILFFVLNIIIDDQITSSFLKPFFERLRPCHDEVLKSQIDMIIMDCGGKYGFASSHAANTMGLSFLYFLLIRNWFAKVLLVWAIFVGYSRIYLGVHYPFDVLVGFMIGIVSSLLLYFIFKMALKSMKLPTS